MRYALYALLVLMGFLTGCENKIISSQVAVLLNVDSIRQSCISVNDNYSGERTDIIRYVIKQESGDTVIYDVVQGSASNHIMNRIKTGDRVVISFVSAAGRHGTSTVVDVVVQ